MGTAENRLKNSAVSAGIPAGGAVIFSFSIRNRNHLVRSASHSKLCRRFDRVNTISALHTLDEVIFSRIIRLINQIDACLVECHRIEAGKDSDILHAGIFRHCAAVTVYGEVAHYIDICNLVLKIVSNCLCRVRHCLKESVLLCAPHLVRLSAPWIFAFPCEEAQPIESCFNAPP